MHRLAVDRSYPDTHARGRKKGVFTSLFELYTHAKKVLHLDAAHKFQSVARPNIEPGAVGQVFTPLKWAETLITPGLYDLWLDGASVFDPTGGRGHLLEAFVSRAVKNRHAVTDDMLSRLCMTEIDPRCIEEFHARMHARYGISMPAGAAVEADFLLGLGDESCTGRSSTVGRFDVIVGNPPWINFADIPDRPPGYKERLKPLFLRYGLLDDARAALWGGSRVDLAALVLVKALVDHLKAPAGDPVAGPGGAGNGPAAPRGQSAQRGQGESDAQAGRRDIRAGFFLPLSLFRNEGAHNTFRRLLADRDFPLAVERIEDITAAKAFDRVHTRYAMVHFRTRASGEAAVHDSPSAVIRHHPDRQESSGEMCSGRHASTEQGHSPDHDPLPGDTPSVPTLPVSAKPRQGVNTCGANAVFMFGPEDLPDIEKDLLFPLIDRGMFRLDSASGLSADEVIDAGTDAAIARDAEQPARSEPTGSAPGLNRAWRHTSTLPSRYVLLPYDRLTGRVLDGDTLEAHYPRTWAYLCGHRQRLIDRRGSIIRSSITRGLWWALLGVGPYTFAPCKIVWPAYGAHTFTPRLFTGDWIPNQALQCSMSFSDPQAAAHVLEYLRSGAVERALLEAGGAGTPGWAQPGRMRKFFEFREDL